MAEYSQDYSKDVAFSNSYPTGEGSKKIKVGSAVTMYNVSIEDNDSAIPKSDIVELIAIGDPSALDRTVAVMTAVTIIDGAVKKRTRTLTFVNGKLTAVSAESNWS